MDLDIQQLLDDSEQETETDEEPVEAAVLSRVRRGNAGNRLKALLANEQQLEEEEIFKEEVDDVEFIAKDEKDVFDSDFEETSSEDGDAEETEEKRLEREERRAKKAERERQSKKRSKPWYAFERSAAARKRETGQAPTQRKRRFEYGGPGRKEGERTSTRTAAVQFAKQVDEREAEDLERQAKARARLEEKRERRKAKEKVWTQTELVEEALRTEETNKASLEAFYAAEEARKVSQTTGFAGYMVYGPRITLLSTTRGGTTHVCELVKETKKQPKRHPSSLPSLPPAAPTQPPPETAYPDLNGQMSPGMPGITTQIYHKHSPSFPQPSATASPTLLQFSAPETSPALPTRGFESAASGSSLLSLPNPPTSTTDQAQPFPDGLHPQSPLPPAIQPSLAQTNSEPNPEEVLEPMYCRNYLLLAELDQQDDFTDMKSATLQAVFGDHVDWRDPLASSSKTRIPNKAAICPFTGLHARYKDPRTNVPYANIQAYRLLQQVQKQGGEGGYVWSAHFGCFVREAPVEAQPADSGPPDGDQDVSMGIDVGPDPDESEEEVIGRGIPWGDSSVGRATGSRGRGRGRGRGRQSSGVDHIELASFGKRAVAQTVVKPESTKRGAPRDRTIPVESTKKRQRHSSSAAVSGSEPPEALEDANQEEALEGVRDDQQQVTDDVDMQ